MKPGDKVRSKVPLWEFPIGHKGTVKSVDGNKITVNFPGINIPVLMDIDDLEITSSVAVAADKAAAIVEHYRDRAAKGKDDRPAIDILDDIIKDIKDGVEYARI